MRSFVIDALMNPECPLGEHELIEMWPAKPGWREYKCVKCPRVEAHAIDPEKSGLSKHKPHHMDKAK